LAKITNFNQLHLYLVPLLGWPHWNFSKIFGPRLSRGVQRMIRLVILMKHWLVTKTH